MAFTLLVLLALWGDADAFCSSPEACAAQSEAMLQRHKMNGTVQVSDRQESHLGGCGMGTGGQCYTNTDWKHKLANLLAGGSSNFFDTFFKVWDDLSPSAGWIFCWGDRSGSWIVGNTYGTSGSLYDSYQGLTYLRNLFIDPQDSQDWGTVGLYMGFFCPAGSSVDQFTELKAGFAFNKCDSGLNFMLSISADTMECFADKFAPGLSRLAGLVPELSLGISVDRKLSKSVLLAHGDGDDIRVNGVTIKPHLAMSITARLSVGQLVGADDTIGDILAGDLQMQVALGFDGSENVVSALNWLSSSDLGDSLPDLLGGAASAYYVGPAAAAAGLRQAGASSQVVSLVEGMQRATLVQSVTGYVTFALSGVSNGILPDMSFQLTQVNLMLRSGPASSNEDGHDTNVAESHLPGMYFYLSSDLGSFVQTIVRTVLGQVGGLLDVIGVNVDSGISLTANQGIGFFVNTAGLGFITTVNVGNSATTVRCAFKFGNQKLKCKARLGWAELFLQSGKYVVNKINNFAGSGAQEVATFFKENVGGNGAKFAKSVVNKGKKVANKEWDSSGKVYWRDCRPAFDECTHTSSSYAEQMKSFWYFTKDKFLCNEYLNNMYFADISDPDNNPKCIRLIDQTVVFSNSPTRIHIAKKSTERFRIAFDGVTGPYGQVCFQSSSAGSFLNQGRRRRRYWQQTYVRGYDGGRRRRRSTKDGANKMRIYQKLEPGNGGNYEKENGDQQFHNGCHYSVFSAQRLPNPILLAELAKSVLRLLSSQERDVERQDSSDDGEDQGLQLAWTLSAISWALGLLRYRNDEMLFSLASLVKPRFPHFSPHQLQNCLWAFASLGMKEPGPFFGAAVETIEPRIADFSKESLVAILTSFAKVKVFSANLFDDAAEVLASAGETLRPQDTKGRDQGPGEGAKTPRVNIEKELCGEYFLWFHKAGRFVRPFIYGRLYERSEKLMSLEHCVVEHMDKPKEIDYCEAKEGSEFWNKGSKWMKWACKEKLCQLATTGEWKAGRFKQYKQWRARKMPWKATMPGHKSIGYEDAYKKFCVALLVWAFAFVRYRSEELFEAVKCDVAQRHQDFTPDSATGLSLKIPLIRLMV
eukprot:g25534.t1